jgi:outer membrane protein OmpA-like peptidoglycan-associated protein
MQASRLKLVGGLLAVVVAVTGCANMSPVQQGTTAGAGVGAGLGGLIGAATGGGGGGRTAKGAVIGGALGAVVGNIWSSRMEEQKRAMEQATRGTGVEVSQTADNRLKLAIPSDISFDTGKADIKPNFRPILDQFATTLAANQATVVTIIGHTDNTGTDAINDPLSLQRASRARDYLTVRGIAPARFTVAGHGSHEPIVDNNSAANRAKNRRVEIFVAEPQR